MTWKQPFVETRQVDVLIVGGGLTGAALTLALKHSGFETLMLEARTLHGTGESDFDARTLALSGASIQILTMLKVWPMLEKRAAAIEQIHVSEKNRFGRTVIQHEPRQPLGYVVEMQHVQQTLQKLLDARSVLAPAKLVALDLERRNAIVETNQGQITIHTKLVVAADGANSLVRQFAGLQAKIKDYRQQALVTNIGLARAHRQCAYERFTPSGPLALLPMNGLRAALIWSLSPEEAEQKIKMTDQAFLNALHDAFGYRLGRLMKVGQRTLYPLRQVITTTQASWPLVLIGNAAHTLHPVAGQGFNLGLRDVALLAQSIIQDGLTSRMLDGYQKGRQHDQWAITYFTNGLVELFSCPLPGLGCMRSLGLAALDQAVDLKKILMRYAGGFSGLVPDLACGIPLGNEENCEPSI